MLMKKEGFPEPEELVLCTVTNVQFHSVFCKLDEYDKSGMIHISEIAPGRIKNIREFVEEGKRIVCKVLQINLERGHIDLSLRRVNEGLRRTKLNDVKQEQLAEKVVEHVARARKLEAKALYLTIKPAIFEQYGALFPAFEAASRDELDLATLIKDAAIAKELTDAIKARIKPPEVELVGDFTFSSYAPNGMDLIKESLGEALKVNSANVRYKGNGTYHLAIKSDDFKKAEKMLKEATENTLAYAEKHKLVAEFKRQE